MTLAAALIGAASLPSAHAEERRTLRLASTPWSPFTNVEGEQRFAVDLVHEALERAGYHVETSIIEDSALEPSIEKGAYDGSAALWRSAQREKYVLYSVPYLENRLIIVGRKDADVSATSLSELPGKKVALVKGYAYGEAIKQAREPEYVMGPTVADNLHALLEGKVDYVLADALVVRDLIVTHPKEVQAHLSIGKNALLSRPLHFALRRDFPNAKSVVAAFDAEIRKMLADGTYNRILDFNWIRADVDGDGQPEMILRGDRAGTSPPLDGYEILAMQTAKKSPPSKAKFVIGGQVYADWDRVPEKYKVWDDVERTRARSSFTAFTFSF